MNISITNRRWNSQVVWRRSGYPKIHFNAGSTPKEAKSSEMIFEGESDGSQLIGTVMDDREADTIFGRSKGITFTVITSNLEFSSTCRTKNHSQYHCDTLT